MMKVWQFLVLLSTVLYGAEGYSSGAPENACSTLTPRHGPPPQSSQPPYSVRPLQTDVEPGGSVTVRIQSEQADLSFKGFVIQAVDADSPNKVVGSFVGASSGTKTLSCQSGSQNTVTHISPDPKSKVEFTWTSAGNYQGDVLFKCTFVKDYTNFWVQVPSIRVRVGRTVTYRPTFNYPTTYTFEDTATVSSTSSSPINVSTPGTTTTTTATTSTSSSTSAVPSTTTNVSSFGTRPWSFTTPAPVPTPVPRSAVYDGCGNTKGCFGFPDNCIVQGSCTELLTYSLKGANYEFELWATSASPNSYVALAISDDDKMGDDSVTECVNVNGKANVVMSYNAGKSNARLKQANSGLSNVDARYIDGNLYCKFNRDTIFNIEGRNRSFDLRAKNYLLLARGATRGGDLQYHETRIASSGPVSLAETGAVQASKDILVKLHGAFMVSAWMFSASLGILFARYFKQTWVSTQFMGKDLWFVFHRLFMIIVWSLTVAGFIIIFVEIGGWTSVETSKNPHALIGCVTTGLAFIQPFMAYFRPHPGTSKRFIFNWAHWLVGNSAHILATVCLFLAVDLDKAAMPAWANWILVAYVAFHALIHLFLSLAQSCYKSDGSRRLAVFPMRDLAPHQTNQNHFYPGQQGTKEDAHGSGSRRKILTLYVVVIIALSAAFIATIVTGPRS